MKAMIFAALMALNVSAVAGWVLVSNNIDGDQVYVNPRTIESTGQMRSAWFLTNKSRPLQGEASYRSLNEFDCGKGRVRMLHSTFMSEKMGEGQVVRLVSAPSSWDNIAPDSVAEVEMGVICDQR